MNKLYIEFILFLYIFTVNIYAQFVPVSPDEYAKKPITPGYGFSNYFELVPEKVSNNFYKRPKKESLYGIKIKSIYINKNKITLYFRDRMAEEIENMELNIYSISGKLLYKKSFKNLKKEENILFNLSLGNINLKTNMYIVKIVYDKREYFFNVFVIK